MDQIYIVLPEQIGTITPALYGVFTEHIGGCVYDGIYCGENSGAEHVHGFRKMIIDHIKKAGIKLIRWPGGCFAETYDWRDGIGPRDQRPVRINWWHSRDGRYEPNIVGTDEFMDFCTMCEAEPYFAANITSTTPLNLRDWVDYCNSPAGTTTMAKLREANGHKDPYNVKLWGVGNENWGGGGNMSPEYYAMEYRRYAEVIHNTAPGLELIACGANGADYDWSRRLLDELRQRGRHMSGMAFHYYCGQAGDTTQFTTEEWTTLIEKAGRMNELIERHWSCAVANGLEENAKLCIDEWGCWHPEGTGPSKGANLFEQQSTLRDAAVTALTLNIFNNHCEKIRLTAVAQLVNNLHALFLSAGDKCICTPTYHVFEMFRPHHNGQAVRTISPNPATYSVSASEKDGLLTVTVANLSPTEEVTVRLAPLGGTFAGTALVRILGDGDLHAHNTFEQPNRLVPQDLSVPDFDGTLTLSQGAIAAVTVPIAR